MEKWFTPVQPSGLPAARSVLVLAPHPDDEVFGCGGAMALYAQQAAVVRVHILTDGAGYAPEPQRAQTGATRRTESQQAVAELAANGAITCDFGPYQDRALLEQASLAEHIYALLQSSQPQLVFAPSPWEIHPDHQACARAALVALQRWQRACGPDNATGLMFYEVGSPLRTNYLLDVSAVWPQKERAMQCFHSQQQVQNYARHIAGLNAYRTYTLPPDVQYAEAYHYLGAHDLQALAASPQASAPLEVQCTDRWLESALHSASVHAEGLQHAVLAQSRHNSQLEAHYERLVAQLQAELRQQHEGQQTLHAHYERLFTELQNDLRHQFQENQRQQLQQFQESQHQQLQLFQENQRLQLQLQAELDSTRASLTQLQNSRAVRWAGALRRCLPLKAR